MKRVNVTLPDAIYNQAEKIAREEGRTLANLCAFYVEIMTRQEVEKREKDRTNG